MDTFLKDSHEKLHKARQVKSGVETINCHLARQLCFEDHSCSPILETIPRVCGPELVSCSTLTVTKCQAALRTLQAFPFFRPTCLCKEPLLDQECNSFRNFLFDHPCMFVLKKEKDPYPIDALPTCNHALAVCQKEQICLQLYEEFKTNCKVRDGKCLMEDRESCHEAWTNIRFSPMFGCICPNNHMKKRCDRIFSLVNQNPCIVKEISKDTPSTFDGVELENPLVGVKDLKEPKQELTSNGYSTLFHSSSGITRPGTTHKVQNNQSSSGPKPEENTSISFQSTCNQALVMCSQNLNCRTALSPVLQYCNSARCRRQNCMEALQNFYRSTDLTWSLEIAFCLCKKTKNNQDECIVAQEKLHPVCAQQVEDPVPPTCHSLAEYCREDIECRNRLENYEQSCAVDSVTKQCAGPPSQCRKALIGILGTVLRTNCACKGTEISQLYDCMGWQRVLWFNPCVVESQRDFHEKKLRANAPKGGTNGLRSTPGSPTISQPTTTRLLTMLTSTSTTTTQVPLRPVTTTTLSTPSTVTITTTTTTISSTLTTPTPPHITQPAPITSTTTSQKTILITSTTPQPNITTTEPPTKPPPTESTAPPKYCVVQRQHQMDQYILEGEGKRLYRDDESDCSEVCQCSEGESLVCNALCIQRAPCKTDFAFYNHAAPAYQAYRGRCLCYSGRFICMRPPPDQYNLPQGVYLFVGYSEADEIELKRLIRLEIQDAAMHLQGLLLHLRPKSNCVLSLYSITMENIILVAKLADTNSSLTRNLQQQTNFNLLMKEKAECVQVLQEISDRINSRDYLVHSHLLLSIFKMAEVEVVYPVASSCPRVYHSISLNLVVVNVISLLLYTYMNTCKSNLLLIALS